MIPIVPMPSASGVAPSPLEGFVAAWLGVLDDAVRSTVDAELSRISMMLDEAWPDGPPAMAGFWAELARCVPQGTTDAAVPETLSEIHATELHLAFACRRGDPAALARFERDYVSGLGPAVGRVEASPAFVDEILQRLRTKLLVADGPELPKIAHYTGQGELFTWMRVVAVREALSSVRADKRRVLVSDEQLLGLPASATSPELGALKQQYREQFAEAFRSALTELTPAQRNLLRLHYLHGLSIDELGSLLDIHRSSAARRIVKTRQDLLARTRRTLEARLAVGRQDFDQLMGLIASRLDLSIERFLAERDGGRSTAPR